MGREKDSPSLGKVARQMYGAWDQMCLLHMPAVFLSCTPLRGILTTSYFTTVQLSPQEQTSGVQQCSEKSCKPKNQKEHALVQTKPHTIIKIRINWNGHFQLTTDAVVIQCWTWNRASPKADLRNPDFLLTHWSTPSLHPQPRNLHFAQDFSAVCRFVFFGVNLRKSLQWMDWTKRQQRWCCCPICCWDFVLQSKLFKQNRWVFLQKILQYSCVQSCDACTPSLPCFCPFKFLVGLNEPENKS